MSNEEDRKSMDDVLASIRRIVRSEKDPDPASAPVPDPVAESSPAPEPVGEPPAPEARMMPESQPATGSPASSGDVPLALTPDMMMEGDEESVVSQAIDAASTSVAETVTDAVGDVSAGVTGIAGAAAAALPDTDGLKEMVRDVIREELTSSDAAGEAIRSIIRDELTTGEVGRNISQNVFALIQSEIAKAKNS